MDNDVLIFIIAGVVFLIFGYIAHRNGEFYLGRVIRFIGPKMYIRRPIPLLTFKLAMGIGGVLAIVTALTELVSADFAKLKDMKLASVVIACGGFLVSVIMEFVLWSGDTPSGDDNYPDDAGRRKNWQARGIDADKPSLSSPLSRSFGESD